MSNYFIREYSLLAGVSGAETALSIGDARVVFDIRKTSSRENNTAEIRIYNLAENTRSVFDQKNAVTTLAAGYERGAGSGVIISGDVSALRTERDGADVATVVEISEGAHSIREKTASFGLSGVVKPVDVINRLSTEIGLPVNIQGTPGGSPYQSGFAMYGSPLEAMNTVCRKIGYSYTIENGVIQVFPSSTGKNSPVVSFSSSTGMVGTPERVKIDEKNGWRVSTLLNPLAVPAGRVKIDSLAVSGIMKIQSVQHSGDTHGGEWTTTVEGFID